jgi:hypothetical protein
MSFPIGAMSLGDILDRGLKLLLARLPTLYGINFLVMAPFLVVNVIAEVALAQLQAAGEGASQSALVLNLATTGLVFFEQIVLQPIATAATLHVITKEFIGEHVGLWQALGFAFRRFGPIVGTSILVGLNIGVGFLCCLLPGIAFIVWYALTAQVVVVEEVMGSRALARSKALSSGFRWRLVGLLLTVLLLTIGSLAVYAGLQMVLEPVETIPVEDGEIEVAHIHNVIIDETLNSLLQILVEVYGSICLTLFYFDLRIRKEGFDLELAARQPAVALP